MPANLSRRAFLGSAAAGAAALAFTRPATASAAPATALRPDLAEDCRNEFLATYHSYLTYAGDRDELHPISRTGSDFFASGHPVRLTLIEALDTLYVMEADDEFNDGINFVVNDLSFDINANFQVFETIIRLVGGLLSGYHASHNPGVLAKARDLADRVRHVPGRRCQRQHDRLHHPHRGDYPSGDARRPGLCVLVQREHEVLLPHVRPLATLQLRARCLPHHRGRCAARPDLIHRTGHRDCARIPRLRRGILAQSDRFGSYRGSRPRRKPRRARKPAR
jgi:glycosyl hydrolase family 47